ncbi:MAG: methyltransferase regulatory domain-containing protein, partial [Alphaproteobacteria bacterium]|nr:methyltransferase regulatory domain-containing protein [Hyphomicrobiales bacterium]MBV8651929.1 methyltransferase regulatory domain-containing protein [Alphaproteobacteria bacterium]
QLIEGDFEAWRDFDLPDCDYIAMHGVYAWISEAARSAVFDLLASRLKPGGLLYVSYNAYPGWGAVAPLRQFLLDYASRLSGDKLANVAETIRHLQMLRDKGAGYFKENPSAGAMLDDLAGKDIRYVAHEIFVPHWSPQSFSAVAKRMRETGLAFVGSATLGQNYPRPSVKAEFLPLLLKEKDRERAELYRDYTNNTFFRRDVFARIAADTPRREVLPLLEPISFGTSVPLEDLARAIPLPDGEMPLVGEPYDGLRRALANGTKRLPEIVELTPFRAQKREAIAQALQFLAIGNQVVPFAHATTAASASEDWDIPLPLNRRLLTDPVNRDASIMLLSPARGCATVMPRGDALVLLAVAEAPGRAVDLAWDYAEARKAWLPGRSAPATTRDAHRAAFAEIRRSLVGARIAKLIELGVVAPR